MKADDYAQTEDVSEDENDDGETTLPESSYFKVKTEDYPEAVKVMCRSGPIRQFFKRDDVPGDHKDFFADLVVQLGPMFLTEDGENADDPGTSPAWDKFPLLDWLEPDEETLARYINESDADLEELVRSVKRLEKTDDNDETREASEGDDDNETDGDEN